VQHADVLDLVEEVIEQPHRGVGGLVVGRGLGGCLQQVAAHREQQPRDGLALAHHRALDQPAALELGRLEVLALPAQRGSGDEVDQHPAEVEQVAKEQVVGALQGLDRRRQIGREDVLEDPELVAHRDRVDRDVAVRPALVMEHAQQPREPLGHREDVVDVAPAQPAHRAGRLVDDAAQQARLCLDGARVAERQDQRIDGQHLVVDHHAPERAEVHAKLLHARRQSRPPGVRGEQPALVVERLGIHDELAGADPERHLDQHGRRRGSPVRGAQVAQREAAKDQRAAAALVRRTDSQRQPRTGVAQRLGHRHGELAVDDRLRPQIFHRDGGRSLAAEQVLHRVG
jgi:hypothetical protein